MFHIILLSGGSGTRLWPLSNGARAKQFLKILRNENNEPESMVQRVFRQLRKIKGQFDVTVATNPVQENQLKQQVKGVFNVVIEPEGRDTFAAIMLSCAYLFYEKKANVNEAIIVLPIDIFAEQSFFDLLQKLVEKTEAPNEISLIGIKPTLPSEKYGYILPKRSSLLNNFYKVDEFKEKPCSKNASEYIEQGGLWNAGVFCFKLKFAIDKLRSIYNINSFKYARINYSFLPKKSFDYEVLESENNLSVIEYSGDWFDLGTWNTLTEKMQSCSSGCALIDESCKNVHVINESNLPLIVSGLQDSVVIITPDGILVSTKKETATKNFKYNVNKMSFIRPMYEKRKWGEYRVIDFKEYNAGEKSLTKELIIHSGKQISYQKHFKRSEVWTIVSGKGEVVLDGIPKIVSIGDVVNVSSGMLHAIKAIDELHLIEVQIGAELSENDIERFGDFWK